MFQLFKSLTLNNEQLEKLVQGYNTRAYKLGILGSKSPELESIRQELELHIHASRPEKMISVDLKNEAKVGVCLFTRIVLNDSASLASFTDFEDQIHQ